MHTVRSAVGWALAVSVGATAALDAQVQTAPSSVEDEAAVNTVTEEVEEIIIRGQRRPPWGELRLEIRRAQEAIYERFNEINSTDDFDIICRGYRGSSYNETCLSNSWRDFQNRIGSAQAFGGSPWARTGGQALPAPNSMVALLAHQGVERERELNAELRGLATTDEQLKQAVASLGQAQMAYRLSVGNTTLSRQVSATLGKLPYDAELLFEVTMGNDPWQHRLTHRTFTIADVFGEIRKLEVECAEGSERIDYEIGVDWTVPSDRSACVLQVHAKKGTTFRLYEF